MENNYTEMAGRKENICLVFDATNKWITAGIFGGIYDEIHIDAERDSFVKLAPLLKDMLEKNNVIKPDWITTTVGPGSFTGTKISVTTARTLGMIWNIPVMGIDSLSFYIHSIQKTKNIKDIGVLIDAKQNKFYAKISDSLEKNGKLLDAFPDDILGKFSKEQIVFYSDDPDAVMKQTKLKDLPPVHDFPALSAFDLYELGLTLGGRDAASNYDELIPLYLREDSATEKYPNGIK